MAESTNIEWADATFNPWIGCSKVSEACRFCYAEADFDKRRGHAKWGPSGTRVITSDANWRKPLAWDKHAREDRVVWSAIAWAGKAGTTLELAGDRLACLGLSDAAIAKAAGRLLERGCVVLNCAHRYLAMNYTRPRVFCASLADVFENYDGEILDSKGCAHYTRDGDPCEVVTNDQMVGCDSDGYHHTTMHDARARLFRLIDATPNLDWLLLTKRPENIQSMWPCKNDTDRDRNCVSCRDGICRYRQNVWLGTSVENQEAADRRIPELLRCADLCPVRFLSCEPLLGPVDLTRVVLLPSDAPDLGKPDVSIDCLRGWYAPLGDRRTRINWVIAGGESGAGARPCHPDWVRRLRDDCETAGTAFLFKQWGEWGPESVRTETGFGVWLPDGRFVDPHDLDSPEAPWVDLDSLVWSYRSGKSKSGRMLDGRIHDAIPWLDDVGAAS